MHLHLRHRRRYRPSHPPLPALRHRQQQHRLQPQVLKNQNTRLLLCCRQSRQKLFLYRSWRPFYLTEVAALWWYWPTTEQGQALAHALRQGAVPGHASCVTAAMQDQALSTGAVCFPALQRGVLSHLKLKSAGLAHISPSPRYGDVETMLRALEQQRQPGDTYDKSIAAALSPASGFRLEFIYEHHRHHCAACHARGPFCWVRRAIRLIPIRRTPLYF